MRVHGQPYRTLWHDATDPLAFWIIDQRVLPFAFETRRLDSVATTAAAITDMAVRGAGCIGATAAWGMWLAALESTGSWERLEMLARKLKATRPTAVNLAWAVDRQLQTLRGVPPADWAALAFRTAQEIAEEDVAACHAIGQHGLKILERLYAEKQRPLNILTHCNAGWLAFVDHGSATAPIYAAHDAAVPVHVWVDETRPRNQGARLTAWELGQHGVPHTLIVDNAGGHLMQHGMVDMVIVGADRVTRAGDVANKIGTYLKALAAHDNAVPFYVALPSSTIDWSISRGVQEIPIEQRHSSEVLHIAGWHPEMQAEAAVQLAPNSTPALNPSFDVTPHRLITGLLTERGLCAANEAALAALFPEFAVATKA
jgi:methylthioribose-1-phosphate isomerase